MTSSKPTLLTSLALTLILLIANPKSNYALSIGGINVAHIEILGTLYCTVTGNPDPAWGGLQCPPLTGGLATVYCQGTESTTLEKTITNTTRSIQVTLSTVDTLVFNTSACGVYVTLPVATCAALPPSGKIGSALSLLNVVHGATGGIMRLTTGVFSIVKGV